MKLTPQQNMVVYALQQGWELITDSDSSVIICCSHTGQFEFGIKLFKNLLKKGLIYQGDWFHHRFNYVLTREGKGVSTKPVDLIPKLTMLYKKQKT